MERRQNLQELVHLEEERGVKDDVQVLGFDHQVDGSGSPETDNRGGSSRFQDDRCERGRDDKFSLVF